MVELTEKAHRELKVYFKERNKDIGPIRIQLAPGCSGPRLSMTPGEPNDQDEVFENNGFKFVIEKVLNEQVGNIKIDLCHMGFTVDPENPIPDDGSCCANCNACC